MISHKVQPACQGISLDIEGAGITAIIGSSGTGKSILIRCLNRLALGSGERFNRQAFDQGKAARLSGGKNENAVTASESERERRRNFL